MSPTLPLALSSFPAPKRTHPVKLTTSYYTVILERPEILKQYARNQSIEISSHSLLFNPRILKIL